MDFYSTVYPPNNRLRFIKQYIPPDKKWRFIKTVYPTWQEMALYIKKYISPDKRWRITVLNSIPHLTTNRIFEDYTSPVNRWPFNHGSVSQDFRPRFFPESILSGPLTNRLIYFRICLQFRRDSWSNSTVWMTMRKLDSAVCIPLQSRTQQCSWTRGDKISI